METKWIGNKITEARKRVNISQAQLAERLFISPQAVGKWERGESMPDILTFNRLAEILGVDLNYFSEGAQPSAPEVREGLTEIQPGENSSGRPAKKPGWDMSRSNWMDADFSGLKNLHEKFSSSNMLRCRFNGSDLSGLLLRFNNVDSCDFSGSDISNSRIQGSNLAGNLYCNTTLTGTDVGESNLDRCNFAGADFNGARIVRSNINACDFTGADFTGATLKLGGFRKNTMTRARLSNTSFKDMRLDDIVFEGTMEDCSFENCGFRQVVFQETTLLNTFFKNNKNLKRIRFANCKADRMTYEFLKQGKADLSGVELLTDENK